jgi:adenosylcobinamide-GDP ribazoletransferase
MAAGIITTLLLFAGLQASASIAVAIIIGEVCAKLSMVFLTVYGSPFREGIHSYLHSYARPYFPFLATFFCTPLFFLPVAPVKIVLALGTALACSVILLFQAKSLFGGVNGDIAGASNEITRAAVIIILVLL